MRYTHKGECVVRALVLCAVSFSWLTGAAAAAQAPSCDRWHLAGITLGQSKAQAEAALNSKLTLTSAGGDETAYLVEKSDSRISGVTFKSGAGLADAHASVITLEFEGAASDFESQLSKLRGTWGKPTNEHGRGYLYAEPSRMVEWRDDSCRAFAIMLIGAKKAHI